MSAKPARQPMPHVPDFALRYLGPVLTDMVAAIGLADTMKVVAKWGGTRLWIPDTAAPDSPLVRYLGQAVADKLCRAFGGNRPDIPKGLRVLNVLRDDDIRTNPEGLSVPQLAQRYGLTERRVYHIRGDPMPPALPPRDERQLDMFALTATTPTTNRQRGSHA